MEDAGASGVVRLYGSGHVLSARFLKGAVTMRFITISLAGLLVLGAAARAAEPMPAPVLQFDGTERYEVGGKLWVRYNLSVANRSSFPADLFALAPDLPPCGKNASASRTWVNVHDGDGSSARLYGFCALRSAEELGKLSFALPKEKKPPSSVYITLTDRSEKQTVTSNQVAIGQAPATASPATTSLGQCDLSVHPEERIVACTRLIERGGADDETLASAYLYRCDAYGFKGNHDQALADCSRAIELNGTEPRAFALRSRAHAAKRQYDLAVQDVSEAIRLRPKEAGLYYARGTTYEAAGQPDRAIEDYSQAIRLDPKEGQFHITRGIAYSNGNRLAEALADFNAVIGINPKSHVAYFNRGTVYRKMGQQDRAIADYDEALRLEPKYLLAHLRRADTYGDDMQQYDRAVEGYSQAIALAPRNPFIIYLRARAYTESGRYEEALADHGEALKIDPRFALAYNGRAWTYLKMGTAADGLPDVERALELQPQLAHAYNTRAHIYEALGRQDEAITNFRRALARMPADKSSLEGLKRLGAAP